MAKKTLTEMEAISDEIAPQTAPKWLYDIENPDLAEIPYADRQALREAQFEAASADHPVSEIAIASADITQSMLTVIRTNARAVRAADVLQCVCEADEAADVIRAAVEAGR